MTRDQDQHVFPAGVGSCDVSDACDRLAADAVRSGVFRPVWPDCPAVSGRLITARLEPALGGPSPLGDLLDVLADASGGLVLLDLGGRVDVQCWGSLLATVAARAGVRGALVNGAVRDVDGLQALAFPTFARGVYPGGMRGRLRLTAVDEPVELGDQIALPGAVAVADSSGLVVVAADRFGEVAQAAATLRTREQDRLRTVAGGGDPRSLVDSSDEGER